MKTKYRRHRVYAAARPPRLDISKPDFDIAAPPPPQALEQWRAGVRAADLTSDNVVSIYGVIGEDFWTGEGITAARVAGALRRIGARDIEVHVNSPGGDLWEGTAIYNLLRDHKQKVTVKVMGMAASAASIIAMAGDEIKVGLGSHVMIHNVWSIAIGNRHDFVEVAAYLEQFDQSLFDIYAARTGQSKEDIERWMDAETFFSASEAIKNGFADEMLDPDDVIEDKDEAEKAKAHNAIRRVESMLTQKAGMSRSAARALIQEMKGGRQDAAANQDPGMPGAAGTAKPGAGGASDSMAWVQDARALIKRMKS